MAVMYLVTLLVAGVLYLILGDAGFLKVPALIHGSLVNSVLHLKKTSATAKTWLLSQVRRWLTLLTITATSHLVSDAAVGIPNSFSRCKSVLSQLKHDFPLNLNTAWTSIESAGVSIQCIARTSIRCLKIATVRSSKAFFQLVASAEHLFSVVFIAVFSFAIAVMLLVLADRYPMHMLQAVSSACIITVVFTGLCELSGSCDTFVLKIMATALGFIIQTAQKAVSTATQLFTLPAAFLKRLLSASAAANFKVLRTTITPSWIVPVYKGQTVFAHFWSKAKHPQPHKGQLAKCAGASPASVDAAEAAEGVATIAPAPDVGKSPAATLQASGPLSTASLVSRDACNL